MPSSIATLLANNFAGFYGLPKAEKREHVESVLLFMFRGINTTQLNSDLKDLQGNRKNFRLEVNGSGYLFRVKMFLLYAHNKGVKSHKDPAVKRYARHFMIEQHDLRLINFVAASPALVKLLDSHCKKYKVMTLTRFRTILHDLNNEIQQYAQRMVGKKMLFITRANGYDNVDLASTLAMEGLEAAMKMYPCMESTKHMENVMKRAVHNTGINTIYHYTTQSRSTMFRKEDGTFESLKVSYDSLVKERRIYESGAAGTDAGGMATMSFEENGDSERDVVGDSIAASQLLTAYKGKKRRLLVLMCGELDVKFTRYLRVNKVVRPDKDNEDLFHAALRKDDGLDNYINHALDYLKMDAAKGQRFIKRLRSKLGESHA